MKSIKTPRKLKRRIPQKTPGYDLIMNKVLKMLPETARKYITQLCNALLRRGFFSLEWKVAQIIMIQKLRKPTDR